MTTPAITINTVGFWRPLHWLRSGWQDLMAHPAPSLAYGVLVTVAGWAIVTLAAPHAELFTTVVSGFVLVAPLIAAGIYELTRQREAGEKASFWGSVKSLRRNAGSIADFGIVLLLAGLLWERVAAVMFALSYGGEMGTVADFVRDVFLSGEYLGVVITWAVTGGLLASVIFAVTVVGMPMVIDRDADVVTAMLTSIRTVFANLPAMLFWAALIVSLTAVGMLLALAGLILVMPLLGHASWCAYKDLVRVDTVPG